MTKTSTKALTAGMTISRYSEPFTIASIERITEGHAKGRYAVVTTTGKAICFAANAKFDVVA